MSNLTRITAAAFGLAMSAVMIAGPAHATSSGSVGEIIPPAVSGPVTSGSATDVSVQPLTLGQEWLCRYFDRRFCTP